MAEDSRGQMAGMTGDAIYRNFHEGTGPSWLRQASKALEKIANDGTEEERVILALTTELRTAYQGDAGEAAVAGTMPLATEYQASGLGTGKSRRLGSDQAGAFDGAKAQVVPVPPLPDKPGDFAALADPDKKSFLDGMQAHDAASQTNKRAMENYSLLARSNMKFPGEGEFGTMLAPSGDLGVTTMSAGPGVGSVNSDGARVGGHPITSGTSGTSGVPTDGSPVHLPTPVGGGVPTVTPPSTAPPGGPVAGAPPVTGGPGGGTAPSQQTPIPTDPTQRPGIPVTGGLPPGGEDAARRGGGPGLFGVPGTVGTPGSGGVGGDGERTGSRGGVGGGTGGRGGVPHGAGPGVGAGPHGEHGPTTRGGGVAGRGPGGGSPMGGMPMGAGGGRRDEDTEHERASFVVEPDPHEIFGTDVATAPPTIGVDDDDQ
ncbi:hypothetical protein EV193_101353 [Herbihabitans rhizosphaerae]|uniref:PPE family protein n=1 Tax=Herbihabitans rhizosphaerae TaxID=1872711 RepID=A0A4Q7L5A2_9PSEU|nr:hypothetical protein [Herbihabitans rhizosphaerae]RZS44477.1 hypothetical protein EV193_101353 [Herbihabitans rhizosphaerae]